MYMRPRWPSSEANYLAMTGLMLVVLQLDNLPPAMQSLEMVMMRNMRKKKMMKKKKMMMMMTMLMVMMMVMTVMMMDDDG
jgi:accessory gene regulator protein AgrB